MGYASSEFVPIACARRHYQHNGVAAVKDCSEDPSNNSYL